MTIAVCDDESAYRQLIKDYLQPFTDVPMNIYEFACGEDLVKAYQKGERFDVIFLDIEMRAMTGVEAGAKIRKMDKYVMLIFVTNYTEFIPQAFVLNAFQFLVKPVKQETFNKEFERAVRIYKRRHSRYRIVYKDSVNYLEMKDIIYIETYNRHLRAVSPIGSYEFLGKMGVEEKRLKNYDFIRCHQSYLLNMGYIEKPEKTAFLLSTGQEIPISKHLRVDVMANFNKYISGCCV